MRALQGESLRELLDYDPATGVLTWKTRPIVHFKSGRTARMWNTRYAGKRAGSDHLSKLGLRYRVIGIRHGAMDGNFLEHRIIWTLVFGFIPEDMQIDHIDADSTNNRISNLRLANASQNGANTRIRKRNTTGCKGVSFEKYTNRFKASIMVRGVQRTIGRFDSVQEASNAYAIAALSSNGEYARL